MFEIELAIFAFSILVFAILGFMHLPYVVVSLVMLSIYILYIILAIWREKNSHFEDGGLYINAESEIPESENSLNLSITEDN